MDVVSHLLIGAGLGFASGYDLKDTFITAGFGFLPDVSQSLIYLRLGYLKRRPFWIPENKDWFTGGKFRKQNPHWISLYDIPHSLLCWAFIVIPLVLYFELPSMAIYAYLSHILIDLFTHGDEWGIKPFYPFQWKISGFTDAWAWRIERYLVSWIIIAIFIYILIF
jgi:membrane-bound metal-dependent hydrolase YbcI (DUF457 family)